MNIAKFLILPILKNICKRLLFNFFNGSLLHGPKGLRSRLYDGVRLQGPSHRSSFCFQVGISRPEATPNLHSKTLEKLPLISELGFYIGHFWSFYMVLGRFRSFLDRFRSF